MVDQKESAIASDGFGLAGFLLIMSSLEADLRAGRISKREFIEIISKSRGFLAQYPGDHEVAAFAEDSLKFAEQLVSASLAAMPPDGLN